MKESATSRAVTVPMVGIKTPSLERQSRTTKITVYPFDEGSSSMKSMLIVSSMDAPGLGEAAGGCRDSGVRVHCVRRGETG